MRLSPAYCQLTLQLLTAAAVSLVIFIVPVNPLLHWLTVYTQAAWAWMESVDTASDNPSAPRVRDNTPKGRGFFAEALKLLIMRSSKKNRKQSAGINGCCQASYWLLLSRLNSKSKLELHQHITAITDVPRWSTKAGKLPANSLIKFA